MMNLSAALSAIRANQVALQVVGNNIANANAPDYHRQEVRFTDRPPIDSRGVLIGQGVEISTIHRAYDNITESAITQNITDQSSTEYLLGITQQIETLLTPGQGTVIDRLEDLFNHLESFTANPDNAANRSIIVRHASALATEINRLSAQLDRIHHRLTEDAFSRIDRINSLSRDIVDLNLEIRSAEVRGKTPNDLLDQRDRLVNELATLVDVEIIEINQTSSRDGISEPLLVLSLADGQVQMTDTHVELGSVITSDGRMLLCRKGGSSPIEIHSGELGAIFDARDQVVGAYQQRIDEFTRGLVEGLDRTHTAGIGTHGTFEQLNGHRFVSDETLPLSQVETIIPIQAGELSIAVTDPSGTRVMHEISIDPTVDNLGDIASRISALDHMQAVFISPPGQLTINSAPGSSFDFIVTRPGAIDTSLVSGNAAINVSGNYDGSQDDEFTFEFSGSGTIGVTADLKLMVRDGSGAIVGEFNVGNGYRVDSDLEIGHGLAIQIGTGDVNAGDQFAIPLNHTPDATNFLSALGLNTLFTGGGARDLAISEAIANDESMLATTRSGNPQDGLNAEAMANLRHREFLQGDQSLEEFFADVIGSIGTDVLDLQSTQETLASIGQALEIDRAGTSGVDVNEEAVKMLQFQRAFQSTARYISAVDEMFQTLIAMLG